MRSVTLWNGHTLDVVMESDPSDNENVTITSTDPAGHEWHVLGLIKADARAFALSILTTTDGVDAIPINGFALRRILAALPYSAIEDLPATLDANSTLKFLRAYQVALGEIADRHEREQTEAQELIRQRGAVRAFLGIRPDEQVG